MNTEELIEQLKKSDLWAECPCGEEFKISEAVIFDGTKSFPEEALEIQLAMIEGIEEGKRALEKKKKLASSKAEITATAVNIGKNLEKVFPTMKDFKWCLSDCRFLSDPIDMIVFNGLSTNKIESISFIEAKSGAARLNAHQKAVRDAVNDQKISYKVI
jgi:predicted Holliday junction resolvase-like endonuclease